MPTITYNFTQQGHAAIEKTFESIAKKADRAAASARSTATQTKRGAAQAAKSGQRWAQLEQQIARKKRVALERVATAAKRSADAEVKAAQRKVQKIERLEQQLHAKLTRQREQRVRQEARAANRIAAQRRAAVSRTARRGISGGLHVAGAIGAVVSGVGGAAARQSLQLQDLSTKIAVQARGAGQQAVSPGGLRRGFEEAAAAVPGAKAAGVAKAVQAFVTKTGDLKTALSVQDEIATLMVATGSSGEALGRTMADLMEKFDIKSVSDMRQAMADLSAQGKKGSFELEDAAQNFAKIGAAAERFGGLRGVGGLKVLGGLTQIARRATPSGQEAATAVESMFKQLVMKSSMIERGAKVKVFKDKGKTQARDIQDVLVETIAGFEGNLEKLQKVFDVRGIRAVSPLIAEFNRVTAAAPGTQAEKTAAGMAALREMLRDNIEAGGTWAEVQQDAAIMGKTSSSTLTSAWEKVVKAMGSEFTPAIMGAFRELSQLEKETGILTKAGAAVGTIFTAIVEAGALLVAWAERFGLIDKKTEEEKKREGAGRKLREAEAGLADIDPGDRAMMADIQKRYGGASEKEQGMAALMAGIDPAKYHEYAKLTKQRAAARETISGKTLTTGLGPLQARKEFVKRYAATSGGGAYAKVQAQRLADKLQIDPQAAMGKATGERDVAGSFLGQALASYVPGGKFITGGMAKTDPQIEAMQDYAETLVAAKNKIEDTDVADALGAIQEAATGAAKALLLVGQGAGGTVYPPP